MQAKIIVAVVFLLVVIACGVAVQILLSRSKRWWPGLFLPVVSLAWSLSYLCGNVAHGAGGTFGHIFLSFLLMNIPTVVLLALYFLFHTRKTETADARRPKK